MDAAASAPTDTERNRRAARWVARLGLVAVLVVTVFAGRSVAVWWLRQTAAQQLRQGHPDKALARLAQADRLAPRDPETDLLRAACYLHLDRPERWDVAIEAARLHAATSDRIEPVSRLGVIRWDASQPIAENEIGDLIASGVSPYDAVTAMFFGLLAQGESARAEELLAAWRGDEPDEPQIRFLSGVFAWWLGDQQQAEDDFAATLAAQPGHIMTQLALAELCEQQTRLEPAADRFALVATRIPDWERPRVGLARTLRRQGRLDQARIVLRDLANREQVLPDTALEWAHVQLDSGDYAEAVRWFRRADLNRPLDADTLRAAASAFAYDEDLIDAQRWFSVIERNHNRYRRLQELRTRLSLAPSDEAAIREYQQLAGEEIGPEADPTAAAIADGGSALYVQHCWACHGSGGDGRGPAARYLFPVARNLRTDKYRMVSSENLVPRLDDVVAVIREGIPGTSMPAFTQLTDNEQRQLAEEVLQFYREGMRETLATRLAEEDEEADDEELDRLVELRTTPGAVVQPPPMSANDPEAVVRGEQIYRQLACDKCHGNDGAGDWTVPLFDDNGQPAVPRDLVSDPMKGGPEAASLYLRLRLGMPGTPHPASPVVSETALVDLVLYCQSLSQPSKSTRTNRQRALLASQRALAAESGGGSESGGSRQGPPDAPDPS